MSPNTTTDERAELMYESWRKADRPYIHPPWVGVSRSVRAAWLAAARRKRKP